MTSRQCPNLPGKQRGAALVISLIILTVITVLSVSAMRSTTLETKIAVNQQFKQLSFQAAESAFAKLLRKKPEVDVPGTEAADPVTNTDYFCIPDDCTRDSTDDVLELDADLDMDLVEISAPGKYKFSGFGLSVVTLIYQADAHGHVTDSATSTHNRMQVALIRD
ncbi:MAG: hypothetical protein GY934_01670 [Gammaproteobacteria bacterium]|nr:hypothetical protein [Gammaproteobacteria bacterium]